MKPNKFEDDSQVKNINYKGPVPAHKPKYEPVPNPAQPTQSINIEEIEMMQQKVSPPKKSDKKIHSTKSDKSGNKKEKSRLQNNKKKTFVIPEKRNPVAKEQPKHIINPTMIIDQEHIEQQMEQNRNFSENTGKNSESSPYLSDANMLENENLTKYVDGMLKNLEKYKNNNYQNHIQPPKNPNINNHQERKHNTLYREPVDESMTNEFDQRMYNTNQYEQDSYRNNIQQDQNKTEKINIEVIEIKKSFWERFRSDKKNKKNQANNQNAEQSSLNRIKQYDIDLDMDFEETNEIPEKTYDYKSVAEKKEKLKFLNSIKIGQILQVIVLLGLFAVSLVITSGAYSVTTPIWESVNPNSNPSAFFAANFVVLFFAVAVCAKSILYGLRDFFMFRATGDSMLSILCVVSFVFSIYLIGKPDLILDTSIHYYNSVVIAGLVINRIGRVIITQKTKENFLLLIKQKHWKAIETVEDESFEEELLKILGDPDAVTAVPIKTDFLKRFLELSLASDSVDKSEKIVVPVCLFSCVALSVGSYIVTKNIPQSISLLIAAMSICSPFSSLLYSNLPIFRVSKKLRKLGAILSGNDTIYEFSQTNAIVVNATDLFPKGTVSLQALKTFEGGRIDESIIDATSVVHSMGSTLSSMFLGIIESRTNILNQVDTIVYEDEMGVSAWVNGRRVLIGNRDLMLNHDIEVPSEEYEQKYKTGGKELVYLATSGILSAMYVVKYHGDSQIGELLRSLNRNNVSIIVRTTDPNITPVKLMDVFGISLENVRVVPDRGADRYKYITKPRSRVDAKLAYSKSVLGYLTGILESVKLGSTISILAVMQTVAIILGYIGITFCAFFSGASWITPVRILLYNGIWTAIVSVISYMRHIK